LSRLRLRPDDAALRQTELSFEDAAHSLFGCLAQFISIAVPVAAILAYAFVSVSFNGFFLETRRRCRGVDHHRTGSLVDKAKSRKVKL
jgi:hypothetical protein